MYREPDGFNAPTYSKLYDTRVGADRNARILVTERVKINAPLVEIAYNARVFAISDFPISFADNVNRIF